MRALIIATGMNPVMEPLSRQHPSPMLPLVDRPFLQHVVEHVLDRGVREIDFALCHRPEKIEEFLGDGSRWGGVFRYHLVADPSRPYRVFQALGLERHGGPLLLGHGDRLPPLPLQQSPGDLKLEKPVLFLNEGGPKAADAPGLAWTGWAWLPGDVAAMVPPDLDEPALEKFLMAGARGEKALVSRPLSVESFEALLESNRQALEDGFPGLLRSGTEVKKGVRIGRGARVHASAEVNPPVHIGENSRIGPGVRLGPHAVVSRDCVVEEGCVVQDAVIFPETYVGEGLDLRDALVDRNQLVNVKVGGGVSIPDRYVLGSITERQFRGWMVTAACRLIAGAILFIASPLLLGMVLIGKLRRQGPTLVRRKVVRQPSSPEPAAWRTYDLLSLASGGGAAQRRVEPGPLDFLFRFLPGLVNVARGELAFVGLPPRSKEEIAALPEDWRDLYLETKAGLVTEAMVMHEGATSVEEKYTSEAYYSVARGIGHDGALLLNYILSRFRLPEDRSKSDPVQANDASPSSGQAPSIPREQVFAPPPESPSRLDRWLKQSLPAFTEKVILGESGGVERVTLPAAYSAPSMEVRFIPEHEIPPGSGNGHNGHSRSPTRDLESKIIRLEQAQVELREAQEQEVELGSKIQRTLLRGRPPADGAGLEVAALTIPSQGIDGDFYDFFRHGRRCLDVLMGDVMGKGVPAALLGAATKSHFLQATSHLLSAPQESRFPEPEDIVGMAHKGMAKELIRLESFVTLCYARFDVGVGRVTYVDCGHTKTIHYRRNTGDCGQLEGENLPFGVNEGEAYRQRASSFGSGDVFLLYSDGLTETRNEAGELFGDDRLRECLEKHVHLGPKEMVEKIRRDVMGFAGPGAIRDDLTCIVVKIRSAPRGPLPSEERRLAVRSDIKELDRIRECVWAFCREEASPALGERAAHELVLAVHEVSSNIMKHAYRERHGERIDLNIQAWPDLVAVEIQHSGSALLTQDVPSPAFDGSQEDGFGLHIIDRCVDEVRYVDGENEVHYTLLIKRRRRHEARDGNGIQDGPEG